MKKKNLIGVIASLGCLLNLMSFSAYADTYTDGTYTGTAMGYADDITVEVTISNGTISNVEIISHDDTPDYIEVAKSVIDDIISTNSTDVDAVSGATYSSNGIIDAVKNALSNASAPTETETTTTAETTETTTSETENIDTDTTTSNTSDTSTTTTISNSSNTTTTTTTISNNSSATTTKSDSSSNSTNNDTNEVSVETTSLETGDHSLIGIITTIVICAIATFGVSVAKKKAKK